VYTNYAFEKGLNLNIMCWMKVAARSYQCKYDGSWYGLYSILS